MNKKAAVSGWIEVITLSMLFIVLLSGVLVYMNGTYGGDHSIGLDTSAIQKNGSLAGFTVTAQQNIEGGETTETDTGLNLKESWTISKNAFSIVYQIVSGAWIMELTSLMLLPEIVGVVLRVLFLMSLIFAVIKLFFKVGL